MAGSHNNIPLGAERVKDLIVKSISDLFLTLAPWVVSRVARLAFLCQLSQIWPILNWLAVKYLLSNKYVT